MPRKINEININDLTQYLMNNEWIKDLDFIGKNGMKFSKIYEDDLFILIIPSRDNVSDYNQRIYETIKVISELEDINIDKIIDDIIDAF